MNTELKEIGLREFLLWLFRRRRRFRVEGNSMVPLLQPGDEILVNLHAYQHFPPPPGDIVIARHPHRPNLRLVKRVVEVIDNERCILKGDNPLESTDSRIFGPVATGQILGRVTARF